MIANQDTGTRWTHNALRPHYRGWNGANADHNYNWWDAIHTDIDGARGLLKMTTSLRHPQRWLVGQLWTIVRWSFECTKLVGTE